MPPGCRQGAAQGCRKGAARMLQRCCAARGLQGCCKGATRPQGTVAPQKRRKGVPQAQVPCIKKRAEAERGAAIACVAALVNFRSQGLVIMRLQGELGPSSGFDWPVQRSSVDNVPPCTRRVLQVCTAAALQCTATDYRGGKSKGRASIANLPRYDDCRALSLLVELSCFCIRLLYISLNPNPNLNQ